MYFNELPVNQFPTTAETSETATKVLSVLSLYLVICYS